MTKKIIAVSLVVLLIAVGFVACGKDKGYLLAKDENGIEHAYVTDANGETVLNSDGNIRVYETDKNGEIATDENGNQKENSVKMPEVVKTDKKYQTKEFVFNIPSGWKPGDSGFVAVSEDGSEQIQVNNLTTTNSNFNALVSEAVALSKKIVDEVKENNGNADLKEGNTKITSNQIDAYYMIFYAEVENEKGEKQTLNTFSAYFEFEGRIYKVFYQTGKTDRINVDRMVELFNNLIMNHVEDPTNNAAQ